MSDSVPGPDSEGNSNNPLPPLGESNREIDVVAAMEDFLQVSRDAVPDDLTQLSSNQPVNTPDQITRTSFGREDFTIKEEASPSSFPTIPGYEILAELGRGGMGVVYKAQHLRLNRPVAIKMILHGKYQDQTTSIRFMIEAEAVAQLAHPHVVGMYEFGQVDEVPFFALEFVGGGTLAEQIARKGKPTARSAAQILAKLADAVATAHKKGILHRDLKPSNVLLTEDGEPKLMDFGLAKIGASDMTATGAVMGTPSYMSPEQAEGKSREIGTEADVYGLGATLYELLTGRPPFRGDSMMATIQRVLSKEPDRPGALDRSIPRDLETICLKCLEKDPRKRYPTAEALGEDLNAFLAGRSISARPVGSLERSWKWCRRNPTVAALLALVIVSLLGGSIAATAFGLRAERERAAAETARQGEAARAESEAGAKQDAENAHRAAQRQLIDLSVANGMTAAKEQDHSLALLWFARAAQLAKDEPELEELNRIRIANWLRQVSLPAGTFSISRFRRNLDRFQKLEFSPDGNYLLAVTTTGNCVVWNCPEARLVRLPDDAAEDSAAAWQPGTGRLAIADKEGTITLLAPPEFVPVGEVKTSGKISALAFSMDGKRLAWGGSAGARVWDCEKNEYVTPVLHHEGEVTSLVFSSKGELLVTAARDNLARVFRLAPGVSEPLFPPVPHSFQQEHHYRRAPSFASEDRVLTTVVATSAGQALVWRSATSGTVLSRNDTPDGHQLHSVAINRQGTHVAALWGTKGRLWDARTRQILSIVPAAPIFQWNEDLAFSADGKTLVTCGRDTKARFWLVEDQTGDLLEAAHPPIVHPEEVVRVNLASDGRQLATALWDGRVCLWRLPLGVPTTYSTAPSGGTWHTLSPDGRFVLPRGVTQRSGTMLTTRVYEADTGNKAGPTLDPGGILLDAIFSPDGTRVATSSSTARTPQERNGRLFQPDGKSGSVQIWDWKGGARVVGPIPAPSEPRGLAYSPDGNSLAIVCADYRVVIVDPKTGEIKHHLDPMIRTFPLNANLWINNGEAHFNPDGRFLITSEMTPHVHVWDPERGQLLHTLLHNDRVLHFAFHPTNPELLVTSGLESVARIWNLKTGELVAPINHPQGVNDIKFSADGSELITSDDGNWVRVWDWKNGKLKGGWLLGTDPVITADQRWLLTRNAVSFQITDWRSKTPVSPSWNLKPHFNLAMDIPPAERQVILSGFHGSLVGYDLEKMVAPARAPIEDLVQLAELAAGRRIVDEGSVVPLNGVEWEDRWVHSQQTVRPFLAQTPFVPSWTAAQASFDRGMAQSKSGNREKAVAAFREAVRLNPEFADAHFQLGFTLEANSDYDGAIVAYRDVIRLTPANPAAHNNLGAALRAKKDWDGAIAAFGEAVRLQINWAPAYINLAELLSEHGEHFRGLQVLRDGAKFKAAWMGDLNTGFRYDSACCAARAGTGQGKDAPSESDRAALRQEARIWLEADLTQWRNRAANRQMKALVNQKMQHWLNDSDLSAVREPEQLKRLPNEESAAWERLWAEVKRLRDLTAPPELAPPPREIKRIIAPATERLLAPQPLLDREAFWDNRDWDWYKANIPFFECPDADLQTSYYYRWELLTKHLTYGSPNSGYSFTEFIDRPFWSGAYGAISCPAGHQLYEARWLRDPQYARDFARYWFRTPGAQPRNYSTWLADSIWALHRLHPDDGFVKDLLPDLKTNFNEWEKKHYVAEVGLFWQTGHDDGMEFNINSRQTTDIVRGAPGYRPTLNAYLYADALAIARICELANDRDEAAKYRSRAELLKKNLHDKLWNPERRFFFPLSQRDEEANGFKVKALSHTHQTGQYAGSKYGRELIGYVPWQFSLPDGGKGYEVAWQKLFDKDGFAATFGPTTVERNDPMFLLKNTCCWWSGQSWPYATSQTLKALANLLQEYDQEVVTSADYLKLLKTFAKTHRKHGTPYLAEACHPDTGSFAGHDSYNHSEHYFHSSFNDLIITGLAGLRPRDDDILEVKPLAPAEWPYFALDGVPYKGHIVSITWDRDGTRYNRGKGLRLHVDGKVLASADQLGTLTAKLPAVPLAPQTVTTAVNFAVNNDGTHFPRVSASYSNPGTSPAKLIDGNYWYHRSPPNRWTCEGSPNASDSVVIDFGTKRRIHLAKLHFLDDQTGIVPPIRFDLEYWDGKNWRPISTQTRSPEKPTGRRANAVSFPTLDVQKVRATFHHAEEGKTGLTEFELWGDATLPVTEPPHVVGNLAFNPGDKPFPKASASFTSQFDKVAMANDGKVSFAGNPHNRWTSYGSANETDWLEVDFGSATQFNRVELAIYDDRGGVQPPTKYQVEFWDGKTWKPITGAKNSPEKPIGGQFNEVRFDRVKASKVRIVFMHAGKARSGVSEVFVWNDE
jgi:WD40 repeat protein